jgi:hypothetical protein
VKIIKRHRPVSGPYLARGTDKLLGDVPDRILSVWAIEDRGLGDGMAVMELHWREKVACGRLKPADMEASILPVAQLLSAMLSAYLRGTSIAERQAQFARLVDASAGVLGGEPKRILIASGLA